MTTFCFGVYILLFSPCFPQFLCLFGCCTSQQVHFSDNCILSELCLFRCSIGRVFSRLHFLGAVPQSLLYRRFSLIGLCMQGGSHSPLLLLVNTCRDGGVLNYSYWLICREGVILHYSYWLIHAGREAFSTTLIGWYMQGGRHSPLLLLVDTCREGGILHYSYWLMHAGREAFYTTLIGWYMQGGRHSPLLLLVDACREGGILHSSY